MAHTNKSARIGVKRRIVRKDGVVQTYRIRSLNAFNRKYRHEKKGQPFSKRLLESVPKPPVMEEPETVSAKQIVIYGIFIKDNDRAYTIAEISFNVAANSKITLSDIFRFIERDGYRIVKYGGDDRITIASSMKQVHYSDIINDSDVGKHIREELASSSFERPSRSHHRANEGSGSESSEELSSMEKAFYEK